MNKELFDWRSYIEEIRKYLPIQNPLGVFIHNNMLMAFEDLPFDQGVKKASEMFGAQLTLEEELYQNWYFKGEIDDLELKNYINQWREKQQFKYLNQVPALNLNKSIRRLILIPINIPHAVNYELLYTSKDWEINKKIASLIGNISIKEKQRIKFKKWKEIFRHRYHERVNDYYHLLFIRFISAYLDQGMAIWQNPETDKGPWISFISYLEANAGILPKFLRKVESFGGWNALREKNPDLIVDELLSSVPYIEDVQEYVLDSFLELRGWAGMCNKFEMEQGVVPRYVPMMRLSEYLAIILLLEKLVFDYLIEEKNIELEKFLIEMKNMKSTEQVLSIEQVAYLLDQIEQRFDCPIINLNKDVLFELIELVLKLDKYERCLIWHNVLDLDSRNKFINSIKNGCKQWSMVDKVEEETPSAHFLFCIDDREESIRRHLEKINPRFKTYGVVGFFGVDMKFKSLNHPQALPQCPPVVSPRKTVIETISEKESKHEIEFLRKRKRYGEMAMRFFYNSRSSFSSILFTFFVGPIVTLVLLAKIFFPKTALRMGKMFNDKIVAKPKTEINLAPFEGPDGIQYGYSFEERAHIVANILKMSGIVKDFTPFMFIVAHGSTSTNNPYKNAYGCGACSGRPGIPNSQIFCMMANEIIVRRIVKEKHGIIIPDETFFVSCYHDTSSDQILFMNEDQISSHSLNNYRTIKSQFQKAAELNSFERCRNFEAAKKYKVPHLCHQHVQDRSLSLAEPRPEYGHNNNLGCVIGRRELTQHLFLDRRSFLTSYDWTIDKDGEILSIVMSGAVPVAAGINLDYYFSRVDNEKYGSGSKLPLNIVSLLGVMTGSSSDLRIGLAKQMVEIHRPVRITMVIEAPLEWVKKNIENHPRIKKLIYNSWAHLVVLDPREAANEGPYLFENGEFKRLKQELKSIPITDNVLKYISGRTGPLPYALLRRHRSGS